MRTLRLVAVVATVTLFATYRVDAQTAPERPISNSGCLTFHEVHPQITVQEALRTQVPTGYRIYPSASSEDAQTLLLREIPLVRGSEVADAQAGFDARTSEPIVSFRFSPAGTRAFALFTRDNVGHPFAIVLDDRVISAPVIREPILGGKGQVSGNFTIADAQGLAAKLKSGTCP